MLEIIQVGVLKTVSITLTTEELLEHMDAFQKKIIVIGYKTWRYMI
jgi:hypothetical protein